MSLYMDSPSFRNQGLTPDQNNALMSALQMTARAQQERAVRSRGGDPGMAMKDMPFDLGDFISDYLPPEFRYMPMKMMMSNKGY